MNEAKLLETIERKINGDQAWVGNAARFSSRLRREWLSRGNRRMGKVYQHLRDRMCEINGCAIGDDYPTVVGLVNLIAASPRRDSWLSCIDAL